MSGRLHLSQLGTDVAAIGFGCASLGSRVAPTLGLAALERAFDQGVTWFDVAPSYGDGLAEETLGRFVQGRRDQVQLCTKVGIRPARTSPVLKAARPILRTAVAMLPALRPYISRARPAATKLPLTGAMIEPSIDASLRRLGTDHVDVLALHDASTDEVSRDDVHLALERVIAQGKARTVSIAASAEAGVAGVAASRVYSFVQLANDPFRRSLAALAASLPPARSIATITHSVYGDGDTIERVAACLTQDHPARRAFAEAGYVGGEREMAITFLLDYALAANQAGVTLLSMFQPSHLVFNLTRLNRPRDPATTARLADLLAARAR